MLVLITQLKFNLSICLDWNVAENLVNNRECAKKHDLSIFNIIHQYDNVSDLIKMETILIYLEKPVLCKQKEFDYKVSLFS